MKFRYVFLMSVLLGLMAAQPAAALPAFFSYLDIDEIVIGPRNFDDPWNAQTSVDGSLYMTDTNVFGMAPGVGSIHGGGVAFFTIDDVNQLSADMLVTTVYGQDLTPVGDGTVSLTGFTAAIPELVPLGVETITSRAGNSYSSGPALTVPLSEIGAILPGHDLSWFANGDPNSILYAFQTYAPYGEFLAVPEPSSFVLAFGLGLTVLWWRRKREYWSL